MNNNISFSLSLEKRLEDRKLNLDSEIDNVFTILGIQSLLNQSMQYKKTKGTWDSSNTVSIHIASICEKIHDLFLGKKFFYASNKCSKGRLLYIFES